MVIIMVYDRPIKTFRNDPKHPTKLEILAENLFDAFIDGCIAGLMTGYLANPDIGWKVALGTGLLKFFIRLKELRGKTNSRGESSPT